MSRRWTEIGRVAQVLFVPGWLGFMLWRDWPTSAPMLFLSAPLVVAMLTLAAAQAMSVLWPTRYPTLHALAAPPRLARARNRSAELVALGFVLVGPKNERTLFLDFPSLELWHPEHRTFASIHSVFGIARVSFITATEAGRMLYSGIGGVSPRRDHDLICRVAEGTDAASRLADHLRALVAEKLAGDGPEGASSDALLAYRLAITRRWYVARFGTDEQWSSYDAEQTTFGPRGLLRPPP